MRLLLVEDEELLSALVAKGLRKRGYAVDTAFDGQDAQYQFDVNQYDLVILDLNLPLVDGLEVLRHIREKNNECKVLILSARAQVEDKIVGLDLGANDYLPKPFDFAELEARVRNLLRWNFTAAPALLSLGLLNINTALRQADVGGNAVSLTKKEYSILEYLMLHCGQVVGAEELIEHVWDSAADPFSNVLQYHIHMLKKKLAAVGAQDLLQNVRGQGYILMEKPYEKTT